MDIVEIVLLIAGGIIFILSFFIPDKSFEAGKESTENTKALAEEEVKKLIGQELEAIREHVDDVVEEAVTYAMEKTERSLERLSNEKIMAVSEYSDTVLAEIHKNHEEAMFLYDMLNNKHINLKNTVSEVNRTVKEAEETVQKLAPEAVSGFQKLAPEVVSPAEQKILEKPAEPVAKREPQKWMPEKIIGRQPEGTAAAAPARVSFMQDTDDQGRNNNERILELYKQGKSTVAIAKELGLGVGEVKLVIDLFKNQ